MIDIVNESKGKATSLVIQELTIFNHLRVDLIKNNFENLIANLPSRTIATAHVQKRQILNFLALHVLPLVLQIQLLFQI